jgi:hypothetical protein
LITTGVRLTNDTLTVSYGFEAEVTIDGNSTLNHATLETISTPPHPMGSGSIVNNGTMTLSASALTVGGVTGTGSIVATNNSTVTLDRSYSTTDTIKLTSGHLYLGNYNALFGEGPPIAFLAPITGFSTASAITLDDTQATSEVFAKTSSTAGDLMLFNGATEVASLQISGAAHIYASIVAGTTAFTHSVLLTSNDTGHSLPITG